MSNRTTAYLYLMGATVLWGAASPILKFTLRELSPFQFLSYRFLLAGIFSLAYLIFMKPNLPKKMADYARLIIYGFVSIPLALSFLFLGLERSSVLEFGLIGALGPLMVAIGGALFFKENISKNEQIGIMVAFTGTLITIFSPILFQGSKLVFSGNILLVLFLMTDSAGVLLAKSFSKKFDPLLMVNMAFIVAAITIIPFTIFTGGFQPLVSSVMSLEIKYHLGVIYMAFLSGTLAYLLFIKGERLIEAGEAGLFFYLHPLFAFPLAVFWLGEKITPTFIIGGIIIATGVYIAERQPHYKKATKHPHKRIH